jgi:SAM-dependent methyltransferase
MAQIDCSDQDYTERLVRLQTVWWKRLFDVQAPYRYNLRRLAPGFTLEIGCGIGRNLLHLPGQAVGVDTNASSVAVCRARGLAAFTPAEFKASSYAEPGRFDALLLSHVAEHMRVPELVVLLRENLVHLKPSARIILMTPQEVGYRSDPTHVEFMDFEKCAGALNEVGFDVIKAYSFPFPRCIGRLFIYNEFVTVGRSRISVTETPTNSASLPAGPKP